MAMSKEGDDHEGFYWENQSWAFPSSENSVGSEEKSGEKTRPTSGEEGEEKGAGELAAGRKRSGGSNKGKGLVDQGNEGKEGGGSGGGDGGDGGGESDHEGHIRVERERRKRMRNMFSTLHELLPHLPLKTDKSTIVDEAVSYIKTLENIVETLEKRKLERLGGGVSTLNCPNAMVITPRQLSMNSSTRESYVADYQGGGSPSTNSTISAANSGTSLRVPRFPVTFKSWNSPNVSLNLCGNDAHISVCSGKKPGLLSTICCVLEKHNIEVITAQVSSDSHRCLFMFQTRASVGRGHFLGALPVEEIFKHAVGEIMFWVTS